MSNIANGKISIVNGHNVGSCRIDSSTAPHCTSTSEGDGRTSRMTIKIVKITETQQSRSTDGSTTTAYSTRELRSKGNNG